MKLSPKIVVWISILFALFVVGGCTLDENHRFHSDRYGAADPSDLLPVAAGDFTMGSEASDIIDLLNGQSDEPFTDEHPQHTVSLDAFTMEKTEVSNKQYRACVAAGKCKDPLVTETGDSADYYTNSSFDAFPVLNVTWRMAVDYCTWRGRRLPTEAEWEKAARGDADDRRFPWGWAEPTCDMADVSVLEAVKQTDGSIDIVETCHQFPVPVTFYASSVSPFGLLNATGNVAEWVSDFYAADYYDATKWPGNNHNPSGPERGDDRVVRGGGYTSSAILARVSYRDHKPEDYFDETIGFRCARDGD